MLKIVSDPNTEVPSVLESGVGLDELCRLAAQEHDGSEQQCSPIYFPVLCRHVLRSPPALTANMR